MLGCMGIDGSKLADHWLEQAPQPHTGPEPPVGICLKVARGVIRDWINRKHEEQWQSICGQRQAEGFLKKLSAKKSWKIAQYEHKPSKSNDRPASRILSLYMAPI